MRRAQSLLLASTLLAGSLAAATAMAQEASGPSTSGGSLPYISGKGTPRGEGPRPDPKRQETSGGQQVGTPPAGAASGAAAGTATPSGDASGVRVIDLSKGGDQSPASGKAAVPAGEPKPKPETETAGTPPRPDTAGPATARPAPERVPGPARVDDAKANQIVPAGPARPEADTAATTTTPEPIRRPEDAKPVERKTAGKPATRKTTEASRRDPTAHDRRTTAAGRADGLPGDAGTRRVGPDGYPIDPRAGAAPYGGSPYGTAPRTAERRPAPGSPVYDDDDEDTVTTYRYRRSYYPYGFGSPYYYGPPGYAPPGAIPPYRPPPRVYARPAQPNNGDNCHFHAYPGEGPFHREIRCHWHANPYHPSIRYVR